MNTKELIGKWKEDPSSQELCEKMDWACQMAGIHIINGKFRHDQYAKLDPDADDVYGLMGYLLSRRDATKVQQPA